ncbi:lysoplasmalogenase family protein [Tenacibaculum sp. HL-MS23]|uniref:lysoplasmalogenase family protein n=1 Tax=Tenacibaculum sp. HL-MS23 TaxID=3077734 RepID=UPI0028FC1752|nr:lysoplasmalogenase family protein [Tenacibaculum sp. HL-MS23]WNW02228.1 lysoplasmalogenase family protein [Tenacibaculum sp. HL-MS23]
MSRSFKAYSLVYFSACLLSLFFIDIDKSITEMVIKVFSLMFLSFLYLSSSKKINYFYVFILMNSIASDAFLIFDDDFMMFGILLLLINRFLYIILARKALFNTSVKILLTYLIPSLLLFITIFVLLKPYIQEISLPFFLMGITSAIMIGLSFFNYLKAMNKKNMFFLFGILLIVIADILIAFNKFLDYHILLVIVYTIMYYIARYLICLSMIDKKSSL